MARGSASDALVHQAETRGSDAALSLSIALTPTLDTAQQVDACPVGLPRFKPRKVHFPFRLLLLPCFLPSFCFPFFFLGQGRGSPQMPPPPCVAGFDRAGGPHPQCGVHATVAATQAFQCQHPVQYGGHACSSSSCDCQGRQRSSPPPARDRAGADRYTRARARELPISSGCDAHESRHAQGEAARCGGRGRAAAPLN